MNRKPSRCLQSFPVHDMHLRDAQQAYVTGQDDWRLITVPDQRKR